MGTEQLIGWGLIGAGVLDCVLAVTVIGPRAPDPEKKAVVVAAVASSGVLMMLLGIAFLLGVIPLGSEN